MRTRTLALALALSLIPAACGGGGGDPKEETRAGRTALGGGDAAGAAKHFQSALDGIDQSHPSCLEAKMGYIEAICSITPDAVEAQMMELHKTMPGKVTDKHFATIARALADKESFEQATAVFGAGLKAYPDSTALDSLGKQIVKQAESAGASGALDSLKGLGYTGD